MDIKQVIPGYGYENEAQAHHTDETICRIVIQKLREFKQTIFRLRNFLYELQLDDKLDLQPLWDEADIFSDEVKLRVCRWKPLPAIWQKRLERADRELLEAVEQLESQGKELFDLIFGKLKRNGRVKLMPQLYERFWGECRKKAEELEKQLERTVKLFKKRDVLCNLKPLSLQKTLELFERKWSE